MTGLATLGRAQEPEYQILGRNSVAESWDGSPLVLQVNENANLAQTPNGSLVFAYQNEATQNNQGSIATTSGGGAPETWQVPALANQPSMLIRNWAANNLSVTNISPSSETPIRIQAVGPGMPGTDPIALPTGTPLPLEPGETAQTQASPQYMQMVFACSTGQQAIFVLIGGPVDASGNNAYAVMVNAASNTGPDTGLSPPAGYYATTTSNSYTYQFNWGSSTIFVANMSGTTTVGSEITLRLL